MYNYYPFVNYPFPYAFDEMEPYIDIQTMYLHMTRHLQAYVDNLNRILKPYPQWQRVPLEAMLSDITALPEEIQTPVKNNGGGVYNHRFFFAGLMNSGQQPAGRLSRQIDEQYGGLSNFYVKWKKAAMSVFGSGYAWLVMDGEQNLEIITTANQDTPLAYRLTPVMAIDVWEHAYYLKHKNRRSDYIDDWFRVVNWRRAEALFDEAARSAGD